MQAVATETAASRVAAIKPATQAAVTAIAASRVADTAAGTEAAAPLEAIKVSDLAPTGSEPVAEST